MQEGQQRTPPPPPQLHCANSRLQACGASLRVQNCTMMMPFRVTTVVGRAQEAKPRDVATGVPRGLRQGDKGVIWFRRRLVSGKEGTKSHRAFPRIAQISRVRQGLSLGKRRQLLISYEATGKTWGISREQRKQGGLGQRSQNPKGLKGQKS